MERALASLPEKISSTPNLQLSEALAAQIDEEIKFFQYMRENNLDVGQQMCGAALGVKRDLCDYIGTVNGHVTGVNVMKDITAEDFHGKISSGLFTPVMGRGMVLRWDMMEDVLRMDGEILSFATRRLLGPYLDVWRLILVHRWWGLLAIMMVILLGILDPLLVIGHSAPVAHLFYSHLLAQLPVDVQLHDSLDTQLLQHPRIKSLMAPPNFPDFLSHIGALRIVSTSLLPHQLSLFICDIQPGRQMYQPAIIFLRLRVQYAIAFKGYITERVLAYLVSTSPPIEDAASRRTLLETARARVEELLEAEGMETQLADWIESMRLEESADTALRGKHVIHGELVRENTGGPRKYIGRDIGSIAKGNPYSPERLTQLDEFRSTAAIAILNGQKPFTGPRGCDPTSEIFAEWLLSRNEGVSLLWSANRYGRSPEAFQAAQDENQRLAIFNKLKALALRKADAETYGSHRRAVLLKRFEVAADDALRGRNISFSEATRAVICTNCGAPDIGRGQNTRHRCRLEDEAKDGFAMTIGARQTHPSTTNYLRILFLRDLIDFPRMGEFVVESDYQEMGIYSVCARDYLVDDNGEPLPSLPPGLDLSALGDYVIWRREDTQPQMLLASALDVALREMAEKHDRTIEGTRLMAGSIYARQQDKLWAGKFDGSIIEAVHSNPLLVNVTIHVCDDCNVVIVRNHRVTRYTQMQHGCTPGKKLDIPESAYEFIEASRFVDLPYVLTRFCVYKALVEDDGEFKRALMWG